MSNITRRLFLEDFWHHREAVKAIRKFLLAFLAIQRISGDFAEPVR